MKKFFLFGVMLCLCFALCIPVWAHGGRTDSSGGHYNNSTGEYHYHHGYPAHDHYDMDGDGNNDCPYNFKKTTNTISSSTNKTSPKLPNDSTDYTNSNRFWLFPLFWIIVILIGDVLFCKKVIRIIDYNPYYDLHDAMLEVVSNVLRYIFFWPGLLYARDKEDDNSSLIAALLSLFYLIFCCIGGLVLSNLILGVGILFYCILFFLIVLCAIAIITAIIYYKGY